MSKHVKDYYESYSENERLCRDKAHLIEYITTIHFLEKYLPDNCTVLDACAGSGIYSFHLSEKGYKVTAMDLTQKHIDIINASDNRNSLEETYQGNVLDMSEFEDNSFDAVLCMGALYHLSDDKDRVKAVLECLRVLKKDGIFIFAYLNRNAAFINIMKKENPPIEQGLEIMKNGGFENDVFYAMDFNEAEQLANKFNLEKITNIGIDGLIYPLYDEFNNLNNTQFDLYMKYHLDTCEEPSIRGHSMHGLWIGKKK